MAFGDIWQVRWVCKVGDQIGVNVRHWINDDSVPPSNPSAEEVALHFAQVMAPLYKPLIAVAAEYRGAGAKRIWPLPALNEAVSTSGAGVGEATGDPLPFQVSGLISLRTAFSGRANRGRVYVPFPAESVNFTSGFPVTGYVDQLRNLASLLVVTHTVPIAGGNAKLKPVIFSRTQPGASPTVLSAIARDRWATQRRRGLFGRSNVPPF